MKKLIMPIVLILVICSSCKNSAVPPDRIDPPDTTSTGPDTTSHSFAFQIDTLGDCCSILNDAVIVNDSLAYAVGEIFLKDSSGQIDPQAYSIAVWDGKRWEARRFNNSNGQLVPTIRGILAISSSDIWLAAGGVHHWNGSSQNASASYSRIDLIGGTENGQSVDKLWGDSNDNIYGIGRKGMITHFNGNIWTKIEIGTLLDFQDVWGETSSSNATILAVASIPAKGPERLIAQISATTASAISDSGIPEPLSGVWYHSHKKYYVVGSGVFRKCSLEQSLWQGAPLELTPYYSNAVRGTDTNNVFVVGAFADLLHYNGSTWKSYPALLRSDASLRALAVRGNLMIAVGYWGEKALIISAVRQ